MKKHVQKAVSSVDTFYKANEKWILLGLTVLLILIPLFLAFQFRSYPADLPIADDWATNSVYNSVRADIENQVAQQYPNLPTQNRQELVNTRFDQVLANQGTEIDDAIERTAAQFRAQLKDADGQTYLIAIDPYQYLRQTENIINHGHVGDELRNGQSFDWHILAPIGTPTVPILHTWLGAKFHRFLLFFGDRSVMASFFWLPVLLAVLAVIPAFFLGRRRGGLLAGFFTAILIAVHAGFVGRTAAGFSDTDAYVILLPLLCGWFFLEAFETKWGDWKRWSVFIVLTGFAFGILSWVWEWWYFFDLFLIVLIAYLIFIVVKRLLNGTSPKKLLADNSIKVWATMFLGFIVSTGIFVTLFTSFHNFLNAPFSAAIGRIEGIKAAVNVGSLWPNVQTTVAELNIPSITAIIGNIGGKVLFVIALMGVLAALLPKKGKLLWKDWALLGFGLAVSLYLVGKGTSLSIYSFLTIMAIPLTAGFLLLLKDDRDVDVKYALFLFIWIAASVFTMTKGVRFVLLLIPPFAIAAGIAVSVAYRLLKDWLVNDVKFSRYWVAPFLFVIFCLLLIQPIQAGHRTGLNEVPSMSDAWWDSLKQIDAEAAPDAIINSWWDFGHWFKYVADRAVTFDGGSQNVPHAHWIGRVLITPDEKEALAILRMVDCGNFLGTIDIKEGLPSHDDYEAIALTKEIIMLPHEDARNRLLEEGVSPAQTEIVLNHTHCEPPENYFITSADMVGKGGVWGHFGSWDFARADAYKNLRKKSEAEAVAIMQSKYGWSAEEASSRYYEMQTLPDQAAVNSWVSPWPSYPASSWSGCGYAANGTAVACALRIGIGQQQGYNTIIDGLLVNLTDMNRSALAIGFYDGSGRRAGANEEIKPGTLVMVQNGTFTSYNVGTDFNQAFIIDLTGSPRVLMTDLRNADSMFTRLFFLDGEGTTAFELFSDRNSFNMGRILVWKVDWTKLEDYDLV